ncbi:MULTISPECIES: AAA family ATPase [Leptolyngbya]|uniref:AAA family ATPase n=1 Tax=Leptolyngbya TaxID=47251 RepID=UPI0016872F66|nr:AAA family ATPase [Leptolyngbya sp. FACHB-1624]MBD1858006.1 AAA family ATPase [Leptolyngbya sp. FACHB-1624]
MTLNQQKIDELLNLFKQQYPNWLSFSDPIDASFQKDEVDYKQKLIVKAKTQLSELRLRQQIDSENYDGLIADLQALGQDKENNLLFLRYSDSSDLNILSTTNLDRKAFCKAFYALLYGDEATEIRLSRYLEWIENEKLPNKWTFPTHFLFLCHPDTELFIKPSAFKTFLEFIGAGNQFTSRPSAQTYEAIKHITDQLKDALKPYKPRDMVDIQSFIWVCSYSLKQRSSYWKIAPGENAWQWNECREQGFIAIGWDELGDISHLSKLEFDARRDDLIAQHPEWKWSKTGVNQVWQFSQIQEGDRIVANRGKTEVLGIGTVTGSYYFDATVSQHNHRLPVQWDDLVTRPVNKNGWQRTLIPLTEAEFSDITKSNMTPTSDRPFSPITFELLAELKAVPKKITYLARKNEFKQHLEEPFQKLFRQVATQLPDALTERMETERKIFAKIPKNDFKHGGAWDFYWSAFYPKGGQRTQDAQLFLWMNCDRIEFGFFIGMYGSDQRQQFTQNCKKYYQPLLELLEESLSDPNLFFGSRSRVIINPDNTISGQANLSWQDWLKDPEQIGDLHVAIVLPKSKVLESSTEQLVMQITQTYQQLFPLIILASSSDPIPEIEEYLVGDEPPLTINPPYSLAQCAEKTYMELEDLKDWVQAIDRKRQAVLYGPPGTGKTFLAHHLAQHLIGGGTGFVDVVQFHPAYTYEDFIQGIRPKRVEGGLDYPTVPGRFLEFCKRAQSCAGHPCVLIIDEINRANLAQVFGELMYLLEYRDEKVHLASGELFSIPNNVRILGTMNTADRSIALVDHALRRRFAFLYVPPNYEGLRKYHESTEYLSASNLVSILKQINAKIADPHYQIGTSFFLRPQLETELKSIWKLEIEPYLEEFFFDQPDKMTTMRWEQVKEKLGT